MEIRNLTPHDIVLLREDEKGDVVGVVGFPPRETRCSVVATLPSEGVARATQKSVISGMLEVEGFQVPIKDVEFGEPENLPAPEPGVLLVVSTLTAQAAKKHGRATDDLLCVTDTVRDERGRVLGCLAFSRV